MVHLLERSMLRQYMGKDLIAYGTGFIGNYVIPYLARDPDIRLHGVTDSSVEADDAGVFPGTTLPVRSIRAWVDLMPDATILICSIRETSINEIYTKCVDAGFQDIMCCSLDLIDILFAIMHTSYRSTSNPELSLLCLANEIHETHRASFSEFKGCHREKTVAVVGCGPSLNFYEQIAGIPHIGVNGSFLKKDLSLDYYFSWHYVPEWCTQLRDCKFVKFFAVNDILESEDKFPEYVVEENQARRYYEGGANRVIHKNIEFYPLMGYWSVIFQALHFAIYTRPKRILLIGCDCTADGHFYGGEMMDFESKTYCLPLWLEGYANLKKFVKIYYPDTEIISVNPVGLRGLFHDVYTEGYLEAHPEIDRTQCEILNQSDYEVKPKL